jgi:hypothetical protein
MLTWAGIVALLISVLTYFSGEAMTILRGAAELGAVIALFMLVCAAEAFN